MKIKKLHPDAKIPTRGDSGSNGYDLYSVEDKFIAKGKTEVIDTGIAVDLSGGTLIQNLFRILKLRIGLVLRLRV